MKLFNKAKAVLPALVAGALLFSGAVNAQAAAKPDLKVSTEVVDAVIKKMEDTGALDQALLRAINRLQQKANEEQRAKQEEQQRQQAAMAQNVPGPQTNEYVRGQAEARFSLIEYSDLECPFCKQYHPTVKAVAEAFPGKVNWVWRHFPLSFHGEAAKQEAYAAECAGKLAGANGFWAAIDYVMENTKANGQGLPSATPYVDVAKAAKVDPAKLASCMASPEVKGKIMSDLSAGEMYGVRGTPTTFIRDNVTKKVVPIGSALPAAELTQVVKALIEAAPAE